MRLLPRTPRGTWLLAAAVWLAGCAAVWMGLPFRPRVIVPARTAGYPFGFSLDGRALLDQDYGTKPRPSGFVGSGWRRDRPAADGPMRLWDTQTGRCLGSWPLTDDPFARLPITAVAPDGRLSR